MADAPEDRLPALADVMRALLRWEQWTLLDEMLERLIEPYSEDGTPEAMRRSITIGFHIGFLKKTPMRERESFKRLVACYQAALDASPDALVRSLSAERVLGLEPAAFDV